MFAGITASSSNTYGYEFYGNQPLAWWDATLADSLDVDGSYKISNWRSRWTGKVPTEDWTLSQSTAADQPYYYSPGSGHDGDTNSFHGHNRDGDNILTEGIIAFKKSGTFTGFVCGNDTDRNIDSPLVLTAFYQQTYGISGGYVGQAGPTDWDTDRQWILYNINHAAPKENRMIWAYEPTSSYKYTTNWTPGTYNQYNNPGTNYEQVSGGRLPSDGNVSLFLKTDQTSTAGTNYQKDTAINAPFFFGDPPYGSYGLHGWVVECILFDATLAEFSNAQVEALILQMCKRHNIDSTSGTAGLGY